LRSILFLVILILTNSTSTTCLAQTCDMPQHPDPCVYPHTQGATSVSGLASRGTVDVLINGRVADPAVKVHGGKFNSKTLNPIRGFDTVSVRKTDKNVTPTNGSSESKGSLGICYPGMVGPCINQPLDNATEITGLSSSTVTVYVCTDNSKCPPNSPVNADARVSPPEFATHSKASAPDFAAYLDPVSSYDQVELLNANREVVAGPVPVLMPTVSNKPTCSADTKQKPCVNPIQAGQQSPQLSGYADPNSSLDVKYGSTDAQIKTGSDGKFLTSLVNTKSGDKVTVTEVPPTSSGSQQVNFQTSLDATLASCSKDTKQKPCIAIDKTKLQALVYAAAGSTVEVEYKGKGESAVEDKDNPGSFQADLSGASASDPISITVAAPTIKAPPPVSATVPAAPASGNSSSLYALGLVGINATASGSSGPSQQYFASFDVMLPVPFLGRRVCPRGKPTYPLLQRCWVWLDPRISSAPAPATTALTSFTSPTSLASGASGQTVGQITQTFEFIGGFEWTFNEPYWGRQFGWKGSWARSTVSVISGFGSSTPISSLSNASLYSLNTNLGAQFTQNPSFATMYPQLAQALCGTNYGYTKVPPCISSSVGAASSFKNVAFVLPNRSRFYRDYFAGFRLRTYYFSGDCMDPGDRSADSPASSCHIQNTYPGTFDIRFGQDENVTGGYLRSVVMTLAGTYPIPGTGGTLRIFGSTYLRLRSNRNAVALAVMPSASGTSITDPSTVIQPILPSDQDYYRLGIGTDLIALVSKWMTKSSTSTGVSQ